MSDEQSVAREPAEEAAYGHADRVITRDTGLAQARLLLVVMVAGANAARTASIIAIAQGLAANVATSFLGLPDCDPLVCGDEEADRDGRAPRSTHGQPTSGTLSFSSLSVGAPLLGGRRATVAGAAFLTVVVSCPAGAALLTPIVGAPLTLVLAMPGTSKATVTGVRRRHITVTAKLRAANSLRSACNTSDNVIRQDLWRQLVSFTRGPTAKVCHRVPTLDELADVVKLFLAPQRRRLTAYARRRRE